MKRTFDALFEEALEEAVDAPLDVGLDGALGRALERVWLMGPLVTGFSPILTQSARESAPQSAVNHDLQASCPVTVPDHGFRIVGPQGPSFDLSQIIKTSLALDGIISRDD